MDDNSRNRKRKCWACTSLSYGGNDLLDLKKVDLALELRIDKCIRNCLLISSFQTKIYLQKNNELSHCGS